MSNNASINSRLTGADLRVSITYSNPSLFGDIKYFYQIHGDAGASFSLSTSQSTGAGSRRRLDLTGIRVVVSQAGTIGAFDLFALLINLAVGVGLFRASQWVTDMLARNARE